MISTPAKAFLIVTLIFLYSAPAFGQAVYDISQNARVYQSFSATIGAPTLRCTMEVDDTPINDPNTCQYSMGTGLSYRFEFDVKNTSLTTFANTNYVEFRNVVGANSVLGSNPFLGSCGCSTGVGSVTIIGGALRCTFAPVCQISTNSTKTFYFLARPTADATRDIDSYFYVQQTTPSVTDSSETMTFTYCGNNTTDIGTGSSETCDDASTGGTIDQPNDSTDDGVCVIDYPFVTGGKECILNACGDGYLWSSASGGTEECDWGSSNSDNTADACRTNCKNAHCGDGQQDTGEACDEGDTEPNDGCSTTCQSETCGDGIVQSSEQCDDGGTTGGDGCSEICTLEFCGNGVLDPEEDCDTGKDIFDVGATCLADECSETDCTCEVTTTRGTKIVSVDFKPNTVLKKGTALTDFKINVFYLKGHGQSGYTHDYNITFFNAFTDKNVGFISTKNSTGFGETPASDGYASAPKSWFEPEIDQIISSLPPGSYRVNVTTQEETGNPPPDSRDFFFTIVSTDISIGTKGDVNLSTDVSSAAVDETNPIFLVIVIVTVLGILFKK